MRLLREGRVGPDGTVTAPTVAAIRAANNPDLDCVRGLLQSQRFGRSRRGLTVRHEVRGGSFE